VCWKLTITIIIIIIIIKGTTKTAILGIATQTAGSADVKVQNILHGRSNITCSTDCKYRTASKVCKVGTWFVCGI